MRPKISWSAGTGIAAVAIVACSGAILPIVDGGGGASDASVDKSTAADALPIDDAGASDAAVEAGCADRWCNCLPVKATFCDDFDKPNEKLGEGWTGSDGGFYLDNGTTIGLTDAASSPPNAMGVHVSDSPGRVEAAFSELVAPFTTKQVVVAFDLRVPSTIGNCKSGHPEFVRVSSSFVAVRNPDVYAALGLAGGTPTVYLKSGFAPAPVAVSLGSLPTDTWLRVRLVVQAGPGGDGGTVVKASAFVADAGASDQLDAQAAGSAEIPVSGIQGFCLASVGLLDDNDGGTRACDVAIDNVAIYQ